MKYTARQVLEIKAIFLYAVTLFIIAGTAAFFQYISDVTLKDIIAPLVINSTTFVLALTIYLKKKLHKKTNIIPWLLGFITTSVPIIVKYNYGIKYGWTFAAESYNSSILLLVNIIILQLLFNRAIFIICSIYGFLNWIGFLYYAYISGAEFHFYAIVDGKPIHGMVVLREIYFIMLSMILAYIAYKNMSNINEYDTQTTKQSNIIKKQSEIQHEISEEIKSKMGDLLAQVDEQNLLVTKFNEKMQSQAATFEEVSATLEELRAAAETIHSSSVDQVSGNEKIGNIVDEFKSIKVETKVNLEKTYNEIETVVDKTNTTNESLKDVENTIGKIEEQSKSISDTVSLIVDIADRINLLSLNASIEAARAGEYGKGFAVVADEIGKLANQTSESIKEIEIVLSNSSKITNEGVKVITDTATSIKGLINNMVSSSDKISVLQKSVHTEENYLNAIDEQMVTTINLSKNIDLGTDEQKRAIHNASIAIEDVNSIVTGLVNDVKLLANTSENILTSATDLMEKSKQAI